MYKIVETDKEVVWKSASITPIATLADEYGGRAQIIVSDHCYVLLLCRCFDGGKFERDVVWMGIPAKETRVYDTTCYWFREAVEALKNLPLPE